MHLCCLSGRSTSEHHLLVASTGVVMEQQALRAQLKEYIIEPLLEAALPAPEVTNTLSGDTAP